MSTGYKTQCRIDRPASLSVLDFTTAQKIMFCVKDLFSKWKLKQEAGDLLTLTEKNPNRKQAN